MPRFREEVINVQFASLLNKYGLKANPETIKRGGRRRNLATQIRTTLQDILNGQIKK